MKWTFTVQRQEYKCGGALYKTLGITVVIIIIIIIIIMPSSSRRKLLSSPGLSDQDFVMSGLPRYVRT